MVALLVVQCPPCGAGCRKRMLVAATGVADVRVQDSTDVSIWVIAWMQGIVSGVRYKPLLCGLLVSCCRWLIASRAWCSDYASAVAGSCCGPDAWYFLGAALCNRPSPCGPALQFVLGAKGRVCPASVRCHRLTLLEMLDLLQRDASAVYTKKGRHAAGF